MVVYKVDRLTRSLADFAKIVELFDASAVSFVSITQAFNTTTSMGRLTLNVLLSFAQFEREVTGERIRDKIAASKKKGLWMGGQPALGYDVKDRKLVVNEAEAETVRTIFRRYLDLGSVRELKAALDARGRRQQAPHRGGRERLWRSMPSPAGALYQMLQNRVYRGEIVHKGAAYPGEHPTIVDEDLWRQVQEKLEANGVERTGTRDEAKLAYLLPGVLFDADGEPMTPTHAVKKGVRYRYYVSRRLITDVRSRGQKRTWTRAAPSGDRTGAAGRRATQTFLADADSHHRSIAASTWRRAKRQDARSRPRPTSSGRSTQKARNESSVCCAPSSAALRFILDRIDVDLRADRLVDALLGGGSVETGFGPRADDVRDADAASSAAADNPVIRLTIPAELKRAGMEMKFVLEGADGKAPPDAALVRLLIRAHSLAQPSGVEPELQLGRGRRRVKAWARPMRRG